MRECIDGFDEGRGEDCIYGRIMVWCSWYQYQW